MKKDSNKNVELIKSMGCDVCGRRPADCHHWRSRGAGGHNELTNLTPLCRYHHCQFHRIGAKTFYERYEKHIVTRRLINGLPQLDRGKHG